MLALVLFTDNVFQICDSSSVSFFTTKCPAVKYTDGKKYTARVLALHEDRAVLKRIQRNLEKKGDVVCFKNMQLTKNELSYSDILEKQKEHHDDNNKLYVDPIILPSVSTKATDYVFSLHDQEVSKNFFRIQLSFAECEIFENDKKGFISRNLSSHAQMADQWKKMTVEFHENSRISDDSFADENCNSVTDNLNENNHDIAADQKISIKLDSTSYITTDTMKNSPVGQIGDGKEMEYSTTNRIFDENVTTGSISPNLSSHTQTVDQSKETTGKVLENNRISENSVADENCNSSVTNNLNGKFHDIASDQLNSMNRKEIPSGLKKIIDENETTKYIAEYLPSELPALVLSESELDLNLQTIFGGEKSVTHKHSNVPASKMNNDPNATYSLDLSTLDLSIAVAVGKSSEINRSGFNPSPLLDDLISGNIYDSNGNLIKSVQDENSTLSLPVGSSTILESSAPCSNFIDDGDYEELESLAESNSDDYIPSAEETDSDTGSIAGGMLKKSINHKQMRKQNDSSLNISLGTNRCGMSAPDDADLTVATSTITKSWKKTHFCFYCQTHQLKLARHLELHHKDEEDVKKFIGLPPKTLERKQIISGIRKNGDHLYNTDKRFNAGELLVVRRPHERMKKSAEDFLPCGNCNGQYARSVLRHHFRKCTKKVGKKERLVVVKGRKVSGRVHEVANSAVRAQIFPYMREDNVVRTIRYDKLIILYANKQCDKYGTHQHHFQMIRGRIRLLGRFLIIMKDYNGGIETFTDVFLPRHYDEAIRAVKIVANFDESTHTYMHPAVASNLGTLLRHVGEILRSEYIKAELVHDQKRVEDFLKLMSEDYGTSVNRGVLETQLQNNRRKKVILPSPDDIMKLHNFLKSERETYLERIKELAKDSPEFLENWRKLAEVTVISLQLFNRRRAGEIERIYLEDFDSYQGIDKSADKDTYASLSKEGQSLARKYVRFVVRGKRGRGVPVLVPSNLLDSLQMIRKYRTDVGVSDRNPYVFGIPSKDRDRFKYLRACDLMRQFAQQCGAELPNTLRGTQLRKHIATKCISLNLSDHQVSSLAEFMGHADKIHKNIYRQPVMQNDIIKISQLLEMAQGTQGTQSDDDSTSDEEENATSTVETQNSFLNEPEDNENPSTNGTDCSTNSKTTSIPNISHKSLSAIRPGYSHRRWTNQERFTVLGAFKEMIQAGNMPTGDQMQKLIDENDCLRYRKVPQLRTWLHTQKKKM